MAETIEKTEQPKPFDSAAFIAARNDADKLRLSGKEPAKPDVKPKEEAAAVVAEKEPETLEELAAHPTKLPRSVRRELNRLREQAAEAKGRLAAYEELRSRGDNRANVPTEAAGKADAAADPEPVRATFATDAEFNRALGRWDARQEAKKALGDRDKQAGEQSQQEAFEAHLKAMDEKATADIKLLPDWEEVAKAGESIEYVPAEHMQLLGLIGSSDVKAFVLYHFAKHQDEFKAMLDLTAKPDQQIRAFHRLEGRIEKLYTTEHTEASPAQGAGKAQEDRSNPADTSKDVGRTAVDRDVHKPKPSSEVSARGGTAAPPEPAIGSKEWMAKRNQAQYAR